MGYFLTMSPVDTRTEEPSLRYVLYERGLHLGLMPIPIPLINLILRRLVKRIARARPQIFDRLDGHHHKWFRIDITNLPFVLHLRPHPVHPQLRSYRRPSAPPVQGRIAGTFLTLLGMIDGRYDGDALFFTREIQIEGDTEAVVCLRNALDDLDRNFADDVADFFGATGQKFLNIARKVSKNVTRK